MLRQAGVTAPSPREDGSAGIPPSAALKRSRSNPDYDNLTPALREAGRAGADVDGEAVVAGGAAINTDAVNGPADEETTGHAASAVCGRGGEAGRGGAAGTAEYKEGVEEVGESRCLLVEDGASVLTPCSTDSLLVEAMGNKLTTSRVRGAGGPPHVHGPLTGSAPETKHKLSKSRKTDRTVTWTKSSQAVTWSAPSVTSEAGRARGPHVTSSGPNAGKEPKLDNSVDTSAISAVRLNGGKTESSNNERRELSVDPLGVSTSVAPLTAPYVATGLIESETSTVVANHLNVCLECQSLGLKGDNLRTYKEQTFHNRTIMATAHGQEANHPYSASRSPGPLSPPASVISPAPVSFSEANRAAEAPMTTSLSEVMTASTSDKGHEPNQAFYGDYSESESADVVLRNSPIRDNVSRADANGASSQSNKACNGPSLSRCSSFDPRYASIHVFSNGVTIGSNSNQTVPTSQVQEEEEAIYAIPIPKSHRKPKEPLTGGQETVNGWTSSQKQSADDQETFDNFDENVFNRVEVTCQMKKSTTTGMISTLDNSQTSYRDTFRNDYFSLGRRPKRPRIPTLVDSKGMAVSLDVLLKIRRQNSLEENRASSSSLDTASVDDILKSCSEFDPTAPPGYRSRTSSEVVSRNFRQALVQDLVHQHGGTQPCSNVTTHSSSAKLTSSSTISSESTTGHVAVDAPPGHSHQFIVDHGLASQACADNARIDPLPLLCQNGGLEKMDCDSLRSVTSPMSEGIMITLNTQETSEKNIDTPMDISMFSKGCSDVASLSTKNDIPTGVTPEASTSVSTSSVSITYHSESQAPHSLPDHRPLLSSSSDTQSDTTSLLSPISLSSEDSGQVASNLLTVDTYQEVNFGDASPGLGRKSPNSLAKLEAIEALKWLRAAGFPQYAQMFEDGQFPVELSVVERDHDFLDADSLKSLFRRLETLNKYAGMKIHSQHKKKGTSEEEEDEEDLCALSERWEYQKSARRWSRKEPQSPSEGVSKPLDTRASSHDSLLADQDSGSQTGDSPLMDSKLPHPQDTALPSSGQAAPYSDEPDAVQRAMQKAEVEAHLSMPSSFSPPLRRSASEKVKPTRALWKTMKSKKKAGGGRGIVEISNPVVADKENMQAKLVKFNCRDISPTSNVATTLPHPRNGSERLSVGSPTSPQSAPAITTYTSSFDSPFGSRKSFASQSLRVHSFYADQTDSGNASRDSQLHGFYSAHSKLLQSLESAQQKETGVVKQNKSDNNLKEIFILPEGHQPGRFPTVLQNGYIETKQSAAPGTNEHPSDIPSLSSDVAESYPGVTHEPGHRFSFYDNWLPADGKSDHSGHQTNIPSVPSGSSHLTTGSSHEGHGSNHAVTFDCHKLDSIRESRSSSVLSTSGSQSDSDSRHFLDRHLDQTPYAGGLSSQFRVDKTSRESSAEPSSGGITQSPSLHSGELTESSSLHSSRKTSNAEVVDGASSRSDLKLEYEEFDQILQQLYEKINDLNNYVTKEEKGIPPSQHTRQTPQRSLSVDMTRSQPLPFELDSPVSPNSDSALSPSSPMSTGGIMGGPAEESVEDNSSSGSSGGDSSHSGSDQEVGLTDLSHDDSLDQITHACMERRDSGVGHSLTRASGDRRRKKLRWNSFQKCHRPDVTCRAMQINSLTVSQLVRLQKLSLLKLTSIMEKYLPVNKSGWNWMMAKLMKKKPPDFSGKNVFGVPFTVMAQRTGQPLPQCVLYAMRYLRRTSQNAVGIFRKSGVKSKIQQLRDHLEAHPEISDFEDANAYNVADMLKTYFRDLPECLLTNKMSETFRSIYTYVPQPQRLEAIQAAILLLPDENREVLQSILLFLSDISSHESDHQMNASNLAVCFTPTVFQLGPRYTGSPKRNRKNSPGIPDPREILEQKAAHECLLMMITECKKLFTIPANIFRQLQGTSLAHLEPAPLQDIGNSPADVKAFGQERIQMVLKEAHDKNRGWIPGMVINDVEVFYRKPMDDCPLKEWKLVVDIEAPPIEVLRRIMHERHTWDEDLLSWSVLERLDPHSDIFQYVLSSMAPHPSRHYCVLRYWRSDLNKGACALVTMSVEHSENMDIQGVWAIDLGSFILMEPCGSGRSRVTYITRVDTRGRSPEWYSKVFGHICANFLERLQESFKQESCGPETKV
ncbi:uncharacterized protein LOC106078540 isoform X4 [Biomphalaria glabrata]|uniref:Uncharacterized protein LOC106078540 isoform X4 n=1 Tax=Biomphalaria glabrata TaxID=6526 RepID=A0A9W3B376_BIOGL|nr:uncharacterized protein LOC106078540 isoform X4 [Biomphalaria glabrata]XP_055893920.1 uncharacterized protein LOC106078540 isoform X4 [Biomphalaria glabrata]